MKNYYFIYHLKLFKDIAVIDQKLYPTTGFEFKYFNFNFIMIFIISFFDH
jgi:hypothetical protein